VCPAAIITLPYECNFQFKAAVKQTNLHPGAILSVVVPTLALLLKTLM
jgi:hypothetical protein